MRHLHCAALPVAGRSGIGGETGLICPVLPTWVGPLAQAFEAAGHPLWIVGGFVRNALMGLPEKTDIDCTGAALPAQAAAIARQAGYQAVAKHPTLGTLCISNNDGMLEYTPFRTESYPAGGAHRPLEVQFTDSLPLDAQRRDFTINAIYARARTGELQDPLAGIPDIEHRRLRACSDAHITLKDDALRILRMARLAGELRFEPEHALIEAAREFACQLDDLSPARIQGELRRICLADGMYPAQSPAGHMKALRILEACGALRILLAELYEGTGMRQNPLYHHYDVFEHNLHAYQAAPCRITLRLAALLHDVGKPAAYAQGGNMHGHERIGAQMAQQILQRLGFDRKTTQAVCMLIARHMFDLDGRAKVSTVRTRFAQWGFEFAQDLIALRKSDIDGSGTTPSQGQTVEKWTAILQTMREEGAIDSMADMQITGEQIMACCHVPSGPAVGQIKKRLFVQCALRPHLNRPEQLKREAIRLARSLGYTDAAQKDG